MQVKTTAVIGLGTMGSQIGLVFAQGGYPVIMCDLSEDRISWAKQNIDKLLRRQIDKSRLEEQEAHKIKDRITMTTDIGELKTADLVVEAVFEDLNTKQQVFKQVDQVCPEHTILATNTSTLSIQKIAEATGRPEKCIGTHFLIPAALTPLVELSLAEKTSQTTYNQTVEVLKTCNKDVVTSKDSPGFIINRLYIPFLNEAFLALDEGLASAEDIDKACVKGLGHPVGPLKASDASGLDVVLNCIETLYQELGEKYKPAPLLVKLVEEGDLGRKTGKGVYQY